MLKNILLLASLCSSMLSAQSSAVLKPVSINSKFGYAANGTLVILPQFDKASQFENNGLALVQINKHWGLIDASGSFIKKLVIKDINLSHGKYAFCYGDWESYILNNYNVVEDNLDDGNCSSDLLGIIDLEKGKIIQEPRFNLIGQYKYPEYYSEVTIDNKVGFYLPTSNFIMEPQFDSVVSSSMNYGVESDKIIIVVQTDDKMRYLVKTNKDIQIVDNNLYDDIFKCNYYGKEELYILKNNNKFGLANQEGVIFAPKFSEIEKDCSAKLFWIKSNGKYGFINKKGEEIVSPIYDEVKSFSHSHLAAVRNGNKWGYVDDVSGNVKIDIKYASANPFSNYNEVAVVQEKTNGKFGYIDKEGRPLFGGFIFDSASDMNSAYNNIVIKDGVKLFLHNNGSLTIEELSDGDDSSRED